MPLDDFLFRGSLADLDPAVADLINLEAERQIRRLIMIPSESTIPLAVREALMSAFHNIYAEGYPPEETRTMSEAQIMDVDLRLADFRRYADPRYYKGTEFADLIESLARRRGAELLANSKISADKLFVNVQPLSGAPVNSAVYTALIQPGDTIMGLNLLHGGHLSHGSPAARSGKQYNAVFYGVDPKTELIDYDNVRALAIQHKPKVIIGGYTSYPWAPDWAALRRIADECGAYLLADIAHVAGMVIAGVYPSPVGIADIVTFTTHKTLGGPRGAVMATHKADLAKKLDRGVFPGEQGGPHVQAIAALAVAFKLAATEQFKQLQTQTVRNAARLSETLTKQGLRIVHGGTDTHLLTVDCKSIVGEDGTTLSGDITARLLDLVGVTCNRNTIPGDDSAARPSGIRLGTPWITQRGFREPQIERLGTIIANVMKGIKPFSYDGKGGKAESRGKIDFETFTNARCEIAELCNEAGIDYTLPVVGKKLPASGRAHFADWNIAPNKSCAIDVRGPEVANFLNFALTSAVYGLNVGDSEPTRILAADGTTIAFGTLKRSGEDTYTLQVNANGPLAAEWLQALSDGFVSYDPRDLYGKIPGPVAIKIAGELPDMPKTKVDDIAGYIPNKGYFVGVNGVHFAGPKPTGEPLSKFNWEEPKDAPLKQTPLYTLHKNTLKAKMVPFAGYDMPVWYSGVSQEHAAVRTSAGLFDVTHMGVWEVSGPQSESFLNGVTTNDVTSLKPGQAHYSYLLDVEGTPLDDIYIYRLEAHKFMIVVNASNNDKDWAWINAVREGRVLIDPTRPEARLLTDPTQVTIRDLRDAASGKDRRVDLALQGPKSRDILLTLSGSDADKAKVKALTWSTVTHVNLGGFDLFVSRTGYTGEKIAFELFVNPDEASDLFTKLVDAGATPAGLASRDSTRTEAGLPLYGHELGGELKLTPGDAGFASYVKLWKPFFVGKMAYLARELKRDSVVARFRLDNKGVRPPQSGTAVLDRRGRVVGTVTSCSIDSEGFQTGLVYIKDEFASEGTPILIYSNPNKAQDKLALGDKVTVPDAATVISRFPVTKK